MVTMTETDVTTNICASSRLGMCEVCASKDARYACPKCEVKTCCVVCVQIHKRELNCDGKRDRTKFVPLKHMTEREFMSDYCFLEECTRYTENRKRDHIKRYTHYQNMLPITQHRMRAAALERGTRLNIMLPNFSRHKENSSYLNWKLNRLYWRVEWLFINASSNSKDGTVHTPARFVDERCDEQKLLGELLLKYLNPQQQTARKQHKLLCDYQRAGVGQLQILLRAEGIKCNATRCYVLAAHKTLRENLAGKTIVEFPTIYVSYEQRPSGYDIIESDEEESSGVYTAEAVKRTAQEPYKNAKNKKLNDNELQDAFGLTGCTEDKDDDDESDSDNDFNDDNVDAANVKELL